MRVRSFTELVPWICPVSDGVVACKDGGLMATFEIGGRDADNLLDHEYEFMIDQATRAFSEMSVDPWSIVFTLKNSYDLERDNVSMEIEAAEELNDIHMQYVYDTAAVRPRAFMTLHLGPPARDERFFGNIGGMLAQGESAPKAVLFGLQSMFTGKHAFAYRANELRLAVARVESAMDRLTSILPAWRLRRLHGPDLIGFLRATVSGTTSEFIPTTHSGAWFLDSNLPDSPLTVKPKHLELGDKFIGALSLKEWPQATNRHFVGAIMSCGLESTLSVSFRLLGVAEAKKTIASIKAYAELTRYGIKDYLRSMSNSAGPADPSRADRDKQAVVDNTGEALDAIAGGAAFGYMNVSLAIYAYDEQGLEDRIDFLMKRLAPIYPGVIRETLHLTSAWAATMPCNFAEPVRWSLMSTENLAESAPVFLPLRGSPENTYLSEQTERRAQSLCVLPAAAGGHFHFNFHRGALGHTFVIGASRSGKSVMMNFLISQFTQYMPCRVIIFDKDHSCRINTLLHGGTYLDLTVPDGEDAQSGSHVRLNPLSLIGDPRNWDFVIGWICDMIASHGHDMTAREVERVGEAVQELAQNSPKEQWRLAYLSNLLPLELRAQIATYVEGGQHARYFDNEVDSFSLQTITAFEMGALLQVERVGPLAISYAFFRIQRLLEDSRKPGHPVVPTFIYLEECWFLFENPVFRSRIRDWLKTLAKYAAFVVMATQSIDDMVSDDRKLFSSIRDNVANMIFLPNPRAATKSVADLYSREFGLSAETIQMIASGIQRRDYIVVNEDYIKKLYCQFNSRQLAYLRSDSLALKTLNEEMGRGVGWEKRYLQRMT